MKFYQKMGLGLGAMALTGTAAAAVDTTAALAEFSSVATANTAIGTAMLGAVVAGIAIKWVIAYFL